MQTNIPICLYSFLHSFAGTTAFYLAQHLRKDVELACVPCVGSKTYLLAQMERLRQDANNRMPTILEPPKQGLSIYLLGNMH